LFAIAFIAIVGCAGVVSPVQAQEIREKPAGRDSLLAELRALTARLDSLEAVVAGLRAGAQDTTEAVDELAAIRAAAAEAAAAAATTLETAPAPSGTRSLSSLNPEISATGDFRAQGNSPGPQVDNFLVREFELAFQAALDPYASTKIFFSWEEGSIDLEEGYAYWSGLPGGIRLDGGRIRQQIGELNRVHLHALPQTEYPLVLQEYFGEEGLIGDGVRLYWLAPFSGPGGSVHELTAEATVGSNEVMFEESNRVSFLGHLNNFWQLSPAAFLQVGFTGLYGENPDSSLVSRVGGADLRFSWRPPGRELYRSFTLRSEVYGAQRKFGGIGQTRWGGYVGAEYQLGRSWSVGTRFDWVEPLDGPDGAHDWQIVPTLSWQQSEWVHLRAEWRHLSRAVEAGPRDDSDQFVVQVVWAVGPHKHESY
jgi:hypothetical protein